MAHLEGLALAALLCAACIGRGEADSGRTLVDTNSPAEAGRTDAAAPGEAGVQAGQDVAVAPSEARAEAEQESGGPREAGTGACWVLKTWTPEGCGRCEQTLAAYCSGSADCQPVSLPQCEGLAGAHSIDEGCGYLRLRTDGDSDLHVVSVYEQATRKLIYHYDSGGRSFGCMPELTVGEQPICAEWVTRCQGLGGA